MPNARFRTRRTPLLLGAAFILASCGGDSSTEPVDPDFDDDGILNAVDACPNQPETFNGFNDGDGCPDTLPTANVVSAGPGAWTNCFDGLFGGAGACHFVGDGRNLGPGCANNIRGVVKFLDASNAQLGPSESWSLSEGTFTQVIRSGEAFTFVILSVSRLVVDATAATDQEFFWTDVAC